MAPLCSSCFAPVPVPVPVLVLVLGPGVAWPGLLPLSAAAGQNSPGIACHDLRLSHKHLFLLVVCPISLALQPLYFDDELLSSSLLPFSPPSLSLVFYFAIRIIKARFLFFLSRLDCSLHLTRPSHLSSKHSNRAVLTILPISVSDPEVRCQRSPWTHSPVSESAYSISRAFSPLAISTSSSYACCCPRDACFD